MAFTVKAVSRGDIRLTDGFVEARVLGEGLLPANKMSPSFVVHLNSFHLVGANRQKKLSPGDVQKEVIEVIQTYFSSKIWWLILNNTNCPRH